MPAFDWHWSRNSQKATHVNPSPRASMSTYGLYGMEARLHRDALPARWLLLPYDCKYGNTNYRFWYRMEAPDCTAVTRMLHFRMWEADTSSTGDDPERLQERRRHLGLPGVEPLLMHVALESVDPRKCAQSVAGTTLRYSMCTQQQCCYRISSLVVRASCAPSSKIHNISCTALRGHSQVMVVVLVVHKGGFALKYKCVVGS